MTVKSNLTAYNEYDAKYLQGSCSAGNVHAFGWKFGSEKGKFTMVLSDGTYIKKAKNTPLNKELSDIVYDPNSNFFRFFYKEFVYDGTMDNERMFSTNIRPNATIAKVKQVYYLTHGEADGRHLGVSRNGNILVVWQPEIENKIRGCFIN